MDNMTALVAPVAVVAIALLIRVKAAGIRGIRWRKPRLFSKRECQLSQVSRLHLTPHHSLHLVKWRDVEFLVAASPAGCQVLPPETGGGLPLPRPQENSSAACRATPGEERRGVVPFPTVEKVQ